MNIAHPNKKPEKNSNEKTLVARVTAKAAGRVTNKYYARGTSNDEKISILANHSAQGSFHTAFAASLGRLSPTRILSLTAATGWQNLQSV
ncbi:MAG: hypothetical protein OES79_07300 [Planctomycetota bacterium]|nr:hypothetical protein [Planctomycetota bacterium]